MDDRERFPDEYDSTNELDSTYQTSIVNVFDEYVTNNMPTYLIYIPEKRLVSRAGLRAIFKPETLTETEIVAYMHQHGCTRPTAVGHILQDLLKYAILSHRWLREGEPTYDAMLSRGGGTGGTSTSWTSGPGYDKLRRFCEKAQAYGCLLAWSDTCCIDKTSSMELEEAIRSMFRWYRDAHVCITYLGDVLVLEEMHRDVWFMRGWTLQELLAPRAIRFYGSEWEPLGRLEGRNDKEDERVLTALSGVTHIPIADLRDFSPGTTRVQEKMVWASKRRTTRVEDIAYSLIGIFDVSMQVAYGEGDWAFHRLMETIIQRCDEWETLAWAGPPSGHSSSSVIPKSPRCYCKMDFTNFFGWRQGTSTGLAVNKTFTMTQRGLCIDLSIIRGKMTLRNDGVFSFQASARLPGMSRPFSAVEGRTAWRGETTDWVIGIVNSCDTVGADRKPIAILPAHKEYLCFLLRKDGATWKKVSTNNVLTTRAMYVNNTHGPVETLWL